MPPVATGLRRTSGSWSLQQTACTAPRRVLSLNQWVAHRIEQGRRVSEARCARANVLNVRAVILLSRRQGRIERCRAELVARLGIAVHVTGRGFGAKSLHKSLGILIERRQCVGDVL